MSRRARLPVLLGIIVLASAGTASAWVQQRRYDYGAATSTRTSVSGGSYNRSVSRSGSATGPNGGSYSGSTTVNRSATVSGSTTVNRSVNGGYAAGGCWNCGPHYGYPAGAAVAAGVATGVAVGVGTAAVMGSMTRTLPPACVPVVVGSIAYQQCGQIWYQPSYVGSGIGYVVVAPPR